MKDKKQKQGKQARPGEGGEQKRHWNPWMLLAVVLTAYAFATIVGAVSRPALPITDKAPRIPLNDRNLKAFSEDVLNIAEKKKSKKAQMPARTLLELIEWSERNKEQLRGLISELNPEMFIGVALSVERARENAQRLEDFDLLLREADRVSAKLDDLQGGVTYPDPPDLKGWEEGDLTAYGRNQYRVDSALQELLGVPSGGLSARADPPPDTISSDWDSDSAGKKESAPKPIEWRVVSLSRYGPRILRKSPARTDLDKRD